MNTKWWIFFSIAVFLYVSYKFLKSPGPASSIHYAVLLALMTGLVILSRFFKGGLAGTGKSRYLLLLSLYGFVFVATTFTVSYLVANSRVNFMLFLAYAILNLAIAVKLLDKRYSSQNLLFFALGAQLGFAASIILVGMLTKSNNGLVTASIFSVGFAAALAVIFFRNKTGHKKIVLADSGTDFHHQE